MSEYTFCVSKILSAIHIVDAEDYESARETLDEVLEKEDGSLLDYEHVDTEITLID